jgi:DNA-binding CsgD family transcriptional regulator
MAFISDTPRRSNVSTSERLDGLSSIKLSTENPGGLMKHLSIEKYCLTATEAKIAALIAEGKCPRQISKETGRSLETIRNQLKTAFGKTDTHSQLQLAVKLLDDEA